MKTLRFTLLLLAFLVPTCPIFSQTTSTVYNSSGSVGIGTTTITDQLTIKGNIGFSNGPKINDASGKLQLQAGGTGTGSTGTGSIYFVDSSAVVKGRIGTAGTATGGTITTSGGNTIHTFTSSGTFTVNTGASGTVSYLVVGGGGAGGSNTGGGGGAGGMRTGTLSVTAQAYTITVGAGGAPSGNNGGNSVFSSITATGGGGGGGAGVNGNAGGSGGGAGGAAAASGGGGTGGQGNNGGNSTSAGPAYGSGGGGGASQAGADETTNTGGKGGDGTSSSISGSSVTYAGGGGGGVYTSGTNGAGGAGGGGAGAIGVTLMPTAGTPNTGGGGGGGGETQSSDNNYPGAAGGSGIVIISYTTGSLDGGYGNLYLGATNTSSADLAEYYVTSDHSLEPGDVVCLSNIKVKDANNKDISNRGVLSKCSTPNDPHLIGIISTNPGVILGSIDSDTGNKDKRMLALSGRTPVKVSTSNGPIAIGDYLTSSSIPGVAIKASGHVNTVGIALESYDNNNTKDKITAFVNLGYRKLEVARDDKGNLKPLTKTSETDTFDLLSVNNISSLSDNWSIAQDRKIIAKKLCLNGTCITKDQLKILLEKK